ERLAVQRAGAVLAQGGEVVGSAVPLVGGETVGRVDGIPVAEHAVALDFGEDGGGGNGCGESVAVNDGALGKGAVEADRVNQQIIRGRRELENGIAHGDTRGLIDVDLIDARGVHGGDRPGDGVLTNALGENFAALSGQELGVAQPADAVGTIENDGCGYDGAEQRPTTNFIHASDPPRARI